MKDIKKVILKILAAALAAALIGGILFITNAFVGNPISAMRANKAIKQYVDKNYSTFDLKVDKAKYEFKDGAYVARAKSQTSIDTKFAIYYRKGKVQRDDYESYVLGMFNTTERLSNEYSAIARKIVAEKLGYDNNTTFVNFNKDEYDKLNSILKLDMKFDKEIPINTEVTLRLELKDKSLEAIAKLLTDAHKAFVDNECNFSNYNLYSKDKSTDVMVNNIKPKDIESGELINLLEKAKDNKSGSGLSVFVK